MTKRANYQRVWIITEEKWRRKDEVDLRLRGYRVTRTTLGSGSIMLLGERKIQTDKSPRPRLQDLL